MARAVALATKAPVPARAGNLLAGLAGWTDPTLIKSSQFYPRGVSKPEDRLKYYASQFPIVELDSSYYVLPTPENAQRWVDRTPPDFTFNVKAFAGMTEHSIDVGRLPKDLQDALPDEILARGRTTPPSLPAGMIDEIWKRFLLAIEPLRAAGKLGCVLLQYPPWFHATKAHGATIERARTRLGDVPAAVEFRHASWGAPGRFHRVIELLRNLSMSFVVVDEPQGLPNSMPPLVAVADPKLAIVRFHGHRTETWDQDVTVHQKFGYLYEPDELKPWVGRARQLGASAEKVHLVFNNCMSNYAVLGAKDVMALALAEDAERTRSE